MGRLAWTKGRCRELRDTYPFWLVVPSVARSRCAGARDLGGSFSALGSTLQSRTPLQPHARKGRSFPNSGVAAESSPEAAQTLYVPCGDHRPRTCPHSLHCHRAEGGCPWSQTPRGWFQTKHGYQPAVIKCDILSWWIFKGYFCLRLLFCVIFSCMHSDVFKPSG